MTTNESIEHVRRNGKLYIKTKGLPKSKGSIRKGDHLLMTPRDLMHIYLKQDRKFKDLLKSLIK